MALFDALGAAGLRYIADPANPYGGIVAGRPTLDVVRLPRETLRQRAGDCDDLAVLYAALLQNVGIDTALVDVRDHVFVMFDTGLSRAAWASSAATARPCTSTPGAGSGSRSRSTLVGRPFSDAWRSAAETRPRGRFTVIETCGGLEALPAAAPAGRGARDPPTRRRRRPPAPRRGPAAAGGGAGTGRDPARCASAGRGPGGRRGARTGSA